MLANRTDQHSHADRHVIASAFSTAAPQKVKADSNQQGVPFSSVYELAPVFSVKADNVEIIDEPSQFFNTIQKGIGSARKNIVLASLYLGAEEGRLVDALRQALLDPSRPDLRVNVLIDYFRGTRGPGVSSASLLEPLLREFPDRVTVSLYHTPAFGGYMKKVCPPRFNEAFGLQHIKVYMFDGDVMLSGANLNTDYFVDRQDRYVMFRDSSDLAQYFNDLIRTISGFSYTLAPRQPSTSSSQSSSPSSSPFNLIPPPALTASTHSRDRSRFQSVAASSMQDFCSRWFQSTRRLRENLLEGGLGADGSGFDTVVVPAIQMGQLGVRQDEEVMVSIMDTVGGRTGGDRDDGKWTVNLSSGYLNFPPIYQDRIVDSSARYSVLTAAPEANGFFNSKGVSRHLPAAYTYLEHQLFQLLKSAGRGTDVIIHEYKRPGWTFHAKVIGSSNFGQRSLERDLEAQAVIVTRNEKLRRRLTQNLEFLYQDSTPVTADTFDLPDRIVHPMVKLSARIISSML
ncbi:CDP-diacylglycerol--glycerol-3-phosphate 3-phosphatidyltransferase [Borealophlyctis nickersoniae]|nr:CDP-diacylglycerol--glycerol-3-phosphate 3-phosphatidyltransferase [Borealophlyctis nickersoniae]